MNVEWSRNVWHMLCYVQSTVCAMYVSWLSSWKLICVILVYSLFNDLTLYPLPSTLWLPYKAWQWDIIYFESQQVQSRRYESDSLTTVNFKSSNKDKTISPKNQQKGTNTSQDYWVVICSLISSRQTSQFEVDGHHLLFFAWDIVEYRSAFCFMMCIGMWSVAHSNMGN